MIKGAIIGFGNIAEGHMYGYENNNNLEIVAVVEPCIKRQKYIKETYKNLSIYNNFDELVKNENIHFIDVCTPPYCRFDYMKKGLEAKINVIGEKPFLLKKDQYKQLVELALKNNCILYPSHNYKYAPIIKEMESIILNENFGEIIGGSFKTLRIEHAKGNQHWNKDWRRLNDFSGGGIIEDHGPHSIYIACLLTKSFPTSISCISGSLNKDFKDNEDTALITLYFQNDFNITLELTWNSKIRDTKYYVYGNKESVFIENDNIKHITNTKTINKTIKSDFDDPLHHSWFKAVLEDFSKTIENHSFRWDLIEESFITIATIEAAYLSSSRGGEKVNIPKFNSIVPTEFEI